MSKTLCRCGYWFDHVKCPNANLWIAVKDADHEEFIKAEAEADQLSVEYELNKERVTALDQMTADMRTILYNCPRCDRLYWYRGADGKVEVFAPEPQSPSTPPP